MRVASDMEKAPRECKFQTAPVLVENLAGAGGQPETRSFAEVDPGRGWAGVGEWGWRESHGCGWGMWGGQRVGASTLPEALARASRQDTELAKFAKIARIHFTPLHRRGVGWGSEEALKKLLMRFNNYRGSCVLFEHHCRLHLLPSDITLEKLKNHLRRCFFSPQKKFVDNISWNFPQIMFITCRVFCANLRKKTAHIFFDEQKEKNWGFLEILNCYVPSSKCIIISMMQEP